MKTMKKTFALVLAVVMALALAVPAWAAPTDASDSYKVSSVEVDGIKEGNTLTLDKIVQFNLDAATNEISYTLAGGLPVAYDTVDELAALTPDGYTLAGASETIRIAADQLAFDIAEGNITPIATVTQAAGSGDKAVITDLPAGWYVAVVTGTADTGIIYQNMIIDAMPVVDAENNTYQKAADVKYEVKSSSETVTKGVGDDADHAAATDTTDKYSVGDTVPYEIKTNIPNYPNPSKVAKFVITDTPTNLTDTISTVKVTVNGDEGTGTTAGTIAGKFTVAAAGDGFTVTFDKDYILAHPGAAVTVNYDAVIKADAVIEDNGLTASNTADITFNPNPNDNGEVKPEDTTEDYTYGLSVLKYDEATGTNAPLKGAKFVLYAENGTDVVRAETQVNNDGRLTWDGLEAGTYKLVETVAPAGYKLDSTPRTITLSSSTATGDDPLKDGNQTYVLQTDVPNTQGTNLPATGGIGTKIFYTMGAVLVIGAGVVLVSRKRAGE